MELALVENVCTELGRLAGALMFGDDELGEVDINDDLLDLGFDSVTLLELAGKVNGRFGIDLDTLTFFDFPSLALLAGHLVDAYSDAVRAALGAPTGNAAQLGFCGRFGP